MASEKYTQLLTGRARMAVQIEQTGGPPCRRLKKEIRKKRNRRRTRTSLRPMCRLTRRHKARASRPSTRSRERPEARVARSRADGCSSCWTRRTVPSVPVGGVSYLVDTEPGMNWIAHYFDRRLNRDSISRAFASKEDALREACDLTRRSCVVHFVQGPNDEKIDAVAIAAWCKHHPWRRDPPKPPK